MASSANSAFQDGKVVPISNSDGFASARANVALPLQNKWSVVIDRLNQVCALQRGWDGYGGGPVPYNVAVFATRILEKIYSDDAPPPALVPGGDGTLQIEWHRNGFDIEIDILGINNVQAFRRTLATGAVEEEELTNDFGIVRNWVAAMADSAGFEHAAVA